MIDKDNIPCHVAIIMDGNGRWAEEKGFPRTAGHIEGIKRVEEILETAASAGVKYLTLFAFSSENWKRPRAEIGILMRSLDNFLSRKLKVLMKNNVRLISIGRREPIPGYLWKRLRTAQERTGENTGLTVVLAFNYGARQEIVDAVKKALIEARENRLDIEDLSEENFSKFLYTAGIPDPDLLIRTSGEMRLSNFLLWQLSYAELYFPKTCWPDFTAREFTQALNNYQHRSRRFGALTVMADAIENKDA
jgi:undecaprenyl diphosphate synthase